MVQTATRPPPTTRRSFLLTSSAGIAAVAGCTTKRNANNGGGGTTDSQTLSGNIDIAGSSTVFPLAVAISEEFQRLHPDVNISVKRTGSGGGFQNFFCVGNTDFNNASRPISDTEKDLCASNGVEWIELIVATDALTVVVNNDADFIDCMTVAELKQIWQPNPVTRWNEVRPEWPDEEINRFGAAETSGTFDYFTEAINGEDGAHTQNYQSTETDDIIVRGVQGDEYAIGYLGFSYYYNNPDQVKAIGIDNGNECVKPSLETAKSGEYTPLARPLYTYPAKPSLAEPHIAEFARYFIRNTVNEELVANDVGYVPKTEEEMQRELNTLNEAINDVQSG